MFCKSKGTNALNPKKNHYYFSFSFLNNTGTTALHILSALKSKQEKRDEGGMKVENQKRKRIPLKLLYPSFPDACGQLSSCQFIVNHKYSSKRVAIRRANNIYLSIRNYHPRKGQS